MAVLMVALFMFFLFSHGGQHHCVEAHVHHVVGGDRGWDPSSDVESWSSGRVFRVGDNIWFSYSAAQENIVELKSKEEFESCDVSNPIKMYTDGLQKVALDGEGHRFFTSSSSDGCKNGLKLHVEVLPQLPTTAPNTTSTTAATKIKPLSVDSLAAGPIPAASVRNRAVPTLLGFTLMAMLLLPAYMGF